MICLYPSETGYNAFFSIHLRFIDLNASILGIAFYMRQRFKFLMGNNWAFRLRHKKDHKVCNTLQLIVKDAFKQDEGFLKKSNWPAAGAISDQVVSLSQFMFFDYTESGRLISAISITGGWIDGR